MSAMPLVPFVDISHWQGNVNFKTMAARGVKAVLCKVSQGRSIDPNWTTYARNAKAAGLFVGGYLFMDVTSSASPAEQAQLFLSQLAAGHPNMIHMYDCEWDGGSSGQDAARVVYYKDVMGRVDSALGRQGAIYSIKSFWRDYCSNTGDFVGHDLIVAAPLDGMPPAQASGWEAWASGRGPTPKYWPVDSWSNWAGWQFAVPPGSGPTYGAQSLAIDMDLCTEAAFARWTGQPTPPEDNSMSADDVQALKTYMVSDAYLDIVANHILSQTFPRVKRATDPSTVSPTITLKDLAYVLRNTADLYDGVTAPSAVDDDNRYNTTKQELDSVLQAIQAIPAVATGVVSLQDFVDAVAALLAGTNLESIPGALKPPAH